MNWNNLFPLQKELDEHIKKEQNLDGQDLIKKKTVAMTNELHECINEARFFKFWSNNQKPNTSGYEPCKACEEEGYMYVEYEDIDEDTHKTWYANCQQCDGYGEYYVGNQLLEEYIDTIHLTISLASDFDYTEHNYNDPGTMDLNDLTLGLNQLMCLLPYVHKDLKHNQMQLTFDYLMKLGYQLGFTEKQVIEAYMEKNKVNHVRQQNGY